MATLSVIYKIAADISGLQSSVDRGVGTMERMATVAKTVGSALGIGFSVQAVVGFAEDIVSAADALQKMHDKTDISVEGLQRLQIAGDDAGNTLEQITSGVNMMQKRLASGDSSAIGALAQLGLKLEDVKAMNPERQFYAMADAIRAVKDPAEQVKLAIELFGRAGAELLPVIKRGFDDIKDAAPGMSGATVSAIDAVGDALGRLARQGKGGVAEGISRIIDNSLMGAITQAYAARQALEAALKNHPTLAQSAPMHGLDTGADALQRLNRELGIEKDRQHDAAEAIRKSAEQQKRFTDSVKDATVHLNLSTFTLNRYGAVALPAVSSSLEGVDQELHTLASTTLPDFGISIYDAGRQGTKVFGDLRTSAQQLGDSLMTVFKSIPQTIANAFTGGGGIGGAIKSIGSQLGSTLGESIGKGVAMLGKLGGPIGAAIGSLAGPLIGWIGKLFSSAEKQINPVRQAFVDAAGGLATLNERAHAAGITLDHLLDARTPEAYKRAIDELNKAFNFQDHAMQVLDSTVDKYGFKISELGPTLSAQKLGEQAGQIATDWAVLEAAGISVDDISLHMADSVSKWYQNALKAGIEIPDSMREILHQLGVVGLLTDENGDKYDLATIDATKYAKGAGDKFEILIKTIYDLVDAITRGLGGAIKGIPAIDVPVNVPDLPDVPTYPEAAGGMGHLTGPALFYSRGDEDYAFSGEGSRFGSAPSGTATSTDSYDAVASYLTGPFKRDLARAVRDAMATAA